MAEWKFRAMTKSEKSIDPIQGQFFTTNTVGDISTALIRESVQNSLDAYEHAQFDPKYPVEVCFRIRRDSRAAKIKEAKQYFHGLMPHLKSGESGLNKTNFSMPEESMPYLLIEDYNTYGLEGDPLEFEDPQKDDGGRHNYYWFWRNVGRTSKSDQNLGRWGLGKTVYPASSKWNTFFGLTVQQSDDSKMLLMGQSVLKVHHIDNDVNKYCPYGDFGNFEDKDPNFVSPVVDTPSIRRFKTTFELDRDNKEQNFHGLSLVIPYPLDEIDSDGLIKASVIQYFYPLITGRLVLTVEDDKTNSSVTLESDSLEDVVRKSIYPNSDLDRKNLLELIRISKFASGIRQEEFFTLKVPNVQNKAVWSRQKLIGDLEPSLEQLVEPFDRGEIIPFLVPVKVHPVDSQSKTCWFKVFIQKDESLESSQAHFVRDGITITGINPVTKKHIRALVIIDDPMLAKLLGDAENPAHTEWQRDSPNFKGRYEYGEFVISFVTKSVERLHSWLIPKPKGVDEEALKDFFHVNLDNVGDNDENDQKLNNGNSGNAKSSDRFGILKTNTSQKRKRQFTVSKIERGITITSNFNEISSDQTHILELAYMVPKGMPLKRYNILDFDLTGSNMEIKSTNIRISKTQPNRIEFMVLSQEMKLQIRGFDSERDLYVRVN